MTVWNRLSRETRNSDCIWLGQLDPNQRPNAYQAFATTNWATPQKSSTNKDSYPTFFQCPHSRERQVLSQIAAFRTTATDVYGEPSEIRTQDKRIKSPLL